MNFSVTILGANSAKFAHGRHQTSQVVNHNENLFLVDCGEGTQLQLMRYRIKLSRINHIFISHLHGDHFLGLMGIILTQHLNGRTQELTVYAPPGLDEIIYTQLRVSDTQLKFPLYFKPIITDTLVAIFENEHLVVSAFPLDHRIMCHGFLFEEKVGKRRLIPSSKDSYGLLNHQISVVRSGNHVYSENGEILIDFNDVTLPAFPIRKYAFCSDTKYTTAPVSFVKFADLLYHESTFLSDMEGRASATFHSTARQAALFAQQAEAKQLILGHFSSRYKELTPFLEEALAVFPNVKLAEEGLEISIPYPDIEENRAATSVAEPQFM
jgi:ribonuclease Z